MFTLVFFISPSIFYVICQYVKIRARVSLFSLSVLAVNFYISLASHVFCLSVVLSVYLSFSNSVFQTVQFFNFFHVFQQYYSFFSFKFIQCLSGRSTVTLLFYQFTCLLVIQYFSLFSSLTSFMPFSSIINLSVFSSSSLSQVV